MTVRIAIVTQQNLPDWEVDDRPFEEALTARGVRWSKVAWDDVTADWSQFDAALLRTPWDYAHQVPRFVAWARRAAEATRLLHGADVVAWNTCKTYLRDLESLGVPLAPTVWLDAGTTHDVQALMASRGWARGFIKPIYGQTARETLRFDADVAGIAAAQAHLDRLLPDEGLMLQPYLPSVESFGEVSAILFDGVWSHAVRKIPVPGDYRVQDDFGATDEPWEAGDELASLATAAVAAAGRCLGRAEPLLYARVDAIRDLDGRLVLNELEIVEPSLFFRHAPDAAERLADAIVRRLA